MNDKENNSIEHIFVGWKENEYVAKITLETTPQILWHALRKSLIWKTITECLCSAQEQSL